MVQGTPCPQNLSDPGLARQAREVGLWHPAGRPPFLKLRTRTRTFLIYWE